MLIHSFNIESLPKKLIVEIVSNNFWTNFLLFTNIIVTVVIAYFVRLDIIKKTKKYELNTHIKKIKAEKIIKFCIKVNSAFSKICIKNPISNPISDEELIKLDKLVLSKDTIFLDDKTLDSIKEFKDYIISVRENPKKKNLLKEKGYFFIIKKALNSEEK